ncbi:MAG: FlgD Ig-like domain [Fibrobacteria bacterium]|jgi:hypothetical protein|nr:FlgD Ig-like domain [Fibrobacteria bacterium]
MILKNLSGAVFTATLSLGVSFVAEAGAQAFTKADSGWVRLFNGTDFTGFYSRTYNVSGVNAPLVTPPGSPYSIEYAGTDTAAIRVGTTANQGNIGTLDTTFSHYRLRWEMKHDAVNGNNNAGLTYHVDESAIRMQNNWPRSIEFQGKQSEAGSAFSIQQVTFTTRTSGTGQGSNYVSTGGSLVQACEYGCNGRWYKGNPLIQPYDAATPTVTRWLRFHLVLRGADSAIHIVNDTTVMRLWNMRIFNDSTRTTGSTSSGQASASNNTPARPWDRGGLAWQAEGSLVRYRRLEVMRIPPSTPMNEHFLHRVFLLDTNRSFVVGAVDTIRWRGIGTIPRIKLEYRKTTPSNSSWVTIVDSTSNTGFYAWTVPNGAYGSFQLRISGPDWVQADTAGAAALLVGVLPGATPGRLAFSVPGHGSILTGLFEGTRVEIHDASGTLVRSIVLGSESSMWDLADLRGARVPPGMYFLRALSETRAYRVGRALVW